MSAFKAINPKMALLKEIRAPLTRLRAERAAIKAELTKNKKVALIGAGIMFGTLLCSMIKPIITGAATPSLYDIVGYVFGSVGGGIVCSHGLRKTIVAHHDDNDMLRHTSENAKKQIRAEIAERRQASRMLSLMERSGYRL